MLILTYVGSDSYLISVTIESCCIYFKTDFVMLVPSSVNCRLDSSKYGNLIILDFVHLSLHDHDLFAVWGVPLMSIYFDMTLHFL